MTETDKEEFTEVEDYVIDDKYFERHNVKVSLDDKRMKTPIHNGCEDVWCNVEFKIPFLAIQRAHL